MLRSFLTIASIGWLLSVVAVAADRPRLIVDVICQPEQSLLRLDPGPFTEVVGAARENDLGLQPFSFNSITGEHRLVGEGAMPILYEPKNHGKPLPYPLFYVYGRSAPTALWLLKYPDTPENELAFTKVLGGKIISGRCTEASKP